MDLKDIQKQVEQKMAEQNNRPFQEFEGYSPAEMHQILHYTFEKDSPVKL